MIRVALTVLFLFGAGVFLPIHAGPGLHPSHQDSSLLIRVAVAGFSGNAARAVEAAVSGSLAKDARVKLVDQAQIRPALAATGYDGSINLTLRDARRLGAAIGCDFYVIGKAEAIARSEREGETHRETIVGLMIVDGRSGSLSLFDFINEKAATPESAIEKAKSVLIDRASSYIDRLLDYRAERTRPPNDAGRQSDERVEDIPDPESALAAGFVPPEFLNRVKPEYTREADLADISAVVEAEAVFRSSGEVGDVVITMWAGFGLDESAQRAIRMLKFKPATRDGRTVSVRATVRYNFRRIPETGNDPR